MAMFFDDYHLHKDAKLRKSLLWEVDNSKIDWQEMRDFIVQRVIERGRPDDFYAILNKYSFEEVREAIKRIPHLNPRDLAFVCTVFHIDKKELKCTTSKRLKNQHWSS